MGRQESASLTMQDRAAIVSLLMFAYAMTPTCFGIAIMTK
jgi:hypothetical protein